LIAARGRSTDRWAARFTVKMTWAEIVTSYKLKLDRPPHNLQPHR
jgi:hypothetical protein